MSPKWWSPHLATLSPGLVRKGEGRLLEFLPPSIHLQELSTYCIYSPGLGLWESQIRPLPSWWEGGG